MFFVDKNVREFLVVDNISYFKLATHHPTVGSIWGVQHGQCIF